MKNYKDYFQGLKVLVYDFDGVIVDTSILKTETFHDIFSLYPKFFESFEILLLHILPHFFF